MDWSSVVIGFVVWTASVLVLSRAYAAERLREAGLDQASGLANKNWRKWMLTGIGLGLGASAWLFVTKWYVGIAALCAGYLLSNVLFPRLWLLHYRRRVRRLASSEATSGRQESQTAVRGQVDGLFDQVLDPQIVAQNQEVVNQIRYMSDGLAENNYELFAVNVAVLVASLRRDYSVRIPSEDALLATAGTLNLLPTMNAGLVSVEDMMRSVLDARQCQVRLGTARLSHAHAGEPLSGADLMLNFVMQHAVVGFRATDDEMTDAEILDAVVENKRVIASALARTNEVIGRGKLGSRISCMSQALTKGFMESAETAGMRQKLGLINA